MFVLGAYKTCPLTFLLKFLFIPIYLDFEFAQCTACDNDLD